MKITNKQYTILIIVLVTMLLIYVASYTIINHKKELAKKDIQIETLAKVSAERIVSAQKQSQIEILGGNAYEFRMVSEKNLEDIKKLQETYETNILTFRCYQNQMIRLTENEEVDNEFCKNKANLEQYKTKK